jgi:predicted acetyltransferase
MTEEVSAFWSSSNGLKIVPATQVKVINWQKLLNALMRMKAKSEKMLEGELVIEIADYGRLKLFADGEGAGCRMTDEKADIFLDRLEATRLLLGPAAPVATADLAPIPRSWLPLPMSWNTLDSI